MAEICPTYDEAELVISQLIVSDSAMGTDNLLQ